MDELILWQKSLDRYSKIFNLTNELMQGISSRGNLKFNIQPCSFCKTHNKSCSICEWNNIMGKCSNKDSVWYTTDKLVTDLYSHLSIVIMDIEDKIKELKGVLNES